MGLGKEIFGIWTFKAKSPKGLASECRRKMIKTFDLNPNYVYLWSPKESEEHGYGKCWTVCAEEGPWEWTIELTGYCESLYNRTDVVAQPYNSTILGFYKN
jgi:hypothetical protein